MFQWIENGEVYVVTQNSLAESGISENWLKMPNSIKNAEDLVKRIKDKSSKEMTVYGAFCFESGCVILVPKKETIKNKLTLSSDGAKTLGGILGMAGLPGLLAGGILVGSIHAAEKMVNKLSPRKDQNPENINKMFPSNSKFPGVEAAYKDAIEDIVYMENFEVLFTERGGRSSFKKFWDIDESSDRGLNIFIGDLIYKDGKQRGMIFFISSVTLEKTLPVMEKEKIDIKKIRMLDRVNKKSWLLN
jgi:hypothetical protein